MPQPKEVFVLSEDDAKRIDDMLAAMGDAIAFIFRRRKVKPDPSSLDIQEFYPVVDATVRDYS